MASALYIPLNTETKPSILNDKIKWHSMYKSLKSQAQQDLLLFFNTQNHTKQIIGKGLQNVK